MVRYVWGHRLKSQAVPPLRTSVDVAAGLTTRHPLDRDGDGAPGGSLPAEDRGLDDLRARYERRFGKPADRRWGAKTLKARLEEQAHVAG